jgi:hypothetical protein
MSNVDEKLSESLERAKNYGLRPELDSGAVIVKQAATDEDVLPNLGGDSDARVWTMPAARTHELLAGCEEQQIRGAEVGADNSNEPGLF